MVTFIALKRNRKLMIHTGLLSHRLNESTNEFFQSIYPYYFLVVIIGYLISCTIVVLRLIRCAQFEDIMVICFGVVGIFQCIAMYINVGVEMKKTKSVVLTLQDIIDEGKHRL